LGQARRHGNLRLPKTQALIAGAPVTNPPRKSNRRDFFKGKAAADLVADAVDHLLPEEPEPFPDVAAPSYLVQVGRRAMACEFEVFFNVGQYRHDTVAAMKALDAIDRVEDQLTVYRDDSDAAEINRAAHEHPVAVDEDVFRLLESCLRLHRETDGAFDVTAGPLTKAWGFFRRQGAIPAPEDLRRVLEHVGSGRIQLDPQRQTIAFTTAGVELNFGAIGKGHALDRAAELLASDGVEHCLLHGGQSSILARGDQAGGDGWWVGIGHPLRRGKRMARARLRNQGLGTSGSGTQFFRHQGKRYGHVLDPRTGQPAEKTLSVTVAAPSAAEADALSTAFYVMGWEDAQEYCRSRPEISALFLLPSSGGTVVETKIIGFADADLEILPEPEEQ
ncbi:MAG: FAD:protein FMN transferase, partial [Planctomycetales bacterium]